MNKQEFLNQLEKALSSLPKTEIDKSLLYYSEIIDDSIEEGLTEAQAVARLESIETISQRILYETPLPVLISSRMKNKNNWTNALLIVLGFPLWFPLLVSAGAVLLSLYVSIWSVFISFFAVIVAFGASGIVTLVYAPIAIFAYHNLLNGFGCIGISLILISLSILLMKLSVPATKTFIDCSKKLTRKIKSLFIKKGGVNNESK